MKLIISDEELKSSLKPIIGNVIEDVESRPAKVEILPSVGKTRQNLDPLTKNLIGIEASLGLESQAKIAEVFGVSQPAVSYLSRGLNTPNIETRKPNEDLRLRINENKSQIANVVTNKLLSTLDLFNPEGVDNVDLPRIASSLAVVLRNVSDPQDHNTNAPQFIVFAPKINSENDYNVVQLNEK